MSTPTKELYVHWSHFNFKPEQWREAAKRFLELQQEINKTHDQDDQVDHDCEEFFDCGLCNYLSDLQEHYNEFARAFANLWAIQALNTDDCLRGGGL